MLASGLEVFEDADWHSVKLELSQAACDSLSREASYEWACHECEAL